MDENRTKNWKNVLNDNNDAADATGHDKKRPAPDCYKSGNLR